MSSTESIKARGGKKRKEIKGHKKDKGELYVSKSKREAERDQQRDRNRDKERQRDRERQREREREREGERDKSTCDSGSNRQRVTMTSRNFE